jgi:peptide/nickel transport system substrate-binding protein
VQIFEQDVGMKQVRLMCALAAMIGTAALAQSLPDVPRDKTLISQGWDFYNQVPSPTNFSPYAGVLLHQRNSLHYTVNEMLFYTNHNDNKVLPWQASGFEYNKDFTEVTLKLRDGVTWSDGQPFTAEDVVFTFGMLRSVAPDIAMSSPIKEWVASETAVDKLTVKIKLNKPGPRWVSDVLATGQGVRFVVVPKHIWKDQNPRTFGFFDLSKVWPVGTGPYKLVKADSGSLIFDRRQSWWAIGAKLAVMPAPERIIYRPATVDALPQLYANNEIDIGRSLSAGNFEAAKARNPKLEAWNGTGPVWGGPDGCTYRLAFNNQKAPYNMVEVRQAINSAINRDQIVNLAFEGSMPKAITPFSSYGTLKAYTAEMQDVISAAAIDKLDAKKTEAQLKAKGFTKAADGRWKLPDGQPWSFTVLSPQNDAVGPVLAKQLQTAGIDTVFRPTQDAAYWDAVSTGNFDAVINTHCGSLYDPWQTLEHFHGKYVAAAGQKGSNIRAITRYSNPALSELLDKMEAKRPSPQDTEYMKLVKEATRIVLTDLPQLTLAEELQVLPFNTTYWTGYPNAQNAYVAPFIPWEGFNQVIHRLKPRK